MDNFADATASFANAQCQIQFLEFKCCLQLLPYSEPNAKQVSSLFICCVILTFTAKFRDYE